MSQTMRIVARSAFSAKQGTVSQWKRLRRPLVHAGRPQLICPAAWCSADRSRSPLPTELIESMPAVTKRRNPETKVGHPQRRM